MRDLVQDVRYSISRMAAKPVFTGMVLSALALGIGASTAIFSVVDAILLRPLPYAEAERIVRLYDAKLPELETFPVSPGNFTYFQKSMRSFDQVGAYHTLRPLVLTGRALPEQLDVALVSASMFPLLSVSPILGRGFRSEEDERGRDQVVILSHAMWQQRFGGNRAIIGQSLTLSDKPYTIIGVMPETFRFPADSTQAWVPLGFSLRDRARHGSHHLTVLARLKRGTIIRQAQAEMDAIAKQLASRNPETNAGWQTKVIGWHEDLARPMRRPLLVLAGACSFVLLIACVNVTNLLLARGASRSKAVPIRMAPGASRARIMRQALTESVLLSLAGGLLGSLLAFGALKTLAAIAPSAVPALQNVSVDGRALAFTFAVSILAGILFGLGPAIQLTRSGPKSPLQESARSAKPGGRRRRLQNVLVVFEVSLSLLLLVGAVLLIRSFTKLRAVDPGFRPKNVLTMKIALPKTRYPEDRQQAAYFQRVINELGTLPGVTAAAAVTPLPFAVASYHFAFVGGPEVPVAQLPIANHYLISSRYFALMGVPVLKGRAFTDRDREGAPRVAIINDTMARKYFPNSNPVEEKIFITNGSDVWREIVGVVADVRQSGLDTDSTPQIYEPHLQEPQFAMTIAVRTQAFPARMTESVVQRIMTIDKDQPVTSVRTMDDIVADSLVGRRFSMTLLTLFAAVALMLAATGIYGVLSHAVSQRTQELGIRMSLGARSADVLKLIVGEGAMLAGVGVTIGLGAALLLTPVMRSLLFGVTPTDLRTFAGVAIALTCVALLASYIPARRAASQATEVNREISRINRLILDTAAEGIMGLDGSGRTVFINPTGAALLGWQQEEVIGRELHPLVHPPGESQICPICATPEQRANPDAYGTFLTRNGTPLSVEFTLGTDENAVVITFRDATARLALERAKSEFVATVSHELKTPLTSIRGALGLLAGGKVEPEAAKRLLQVAVSNSDRLLRLVNDILNAERLASGVVELRRTRFIAGEVMTQAVEVMQALADRAAVRLEAVPVEVEIDADFDRLMQTLTNLISNAIKFSPPHSLVRVAAEREGNCLVFRVSDQGRGIPPEKLERIFERFQQVEAGDATHKGGTGLGLPICRSIAVAHGGTLTVSSSPGAGSTFIVTLPLAA